MSGEQIAAAVAAKDTELLDWVETEVISLTAQALGWEIVWAGEDNEPAHVYPVLIIEGSSLREVLAIAKARQEAEIESSASFGQLPPAAEMLSNHPDIPDSQFRPPAALPTFILRQEMMRQNGWQNALHCWTWGAFYLTTNSGKVFTKKTAMHLHPNRGGSTEEFQKLQECMRVLRGQRG